MRSVCGRVTNPCLTFCNLRNNVSRQKRHVIQSVTSGLRAVWPMKIYSCISARVMRETAILIPTFCADRAACKSPHFACKIYPTSLGRDSHTGLRNCRDVYIRQELCFRISFCICGLSTWYLLLLFLFFGGGAARLFSGARNNVARIHKVWVCHSTTSCFNISIRLYWSLQLLKSLCLNSLRYLSILLVWHFVFDCLNIWIALLYLNILQL